MVRVNTPPFWFPVSLNPVARRHVQPRAGLNTRHDLRDVFAHPHGTEEVFR